MFTFIIIITISISSIIIMIIIGSSISSISISSISSISSSSSSMIIISSSSSSSSIIINIISIAMILIIIDRRCARPPGRWGAPTARRARPPNLNLTVGFHNFNLRIFNLRVWNSNKWIVYVFSTRCWISMCQGLGPTKHDEISETDRSLSLKHFRTALKHRTLKSPKPKP